jgi:N-alpha-acetyl-L-2,4-diaminobutyrate deacetylase
MGRRDPGHCIAPGAHAFVYAPAGGVFEPLHSLGERVRRGQAAGRIHCLWDVDRPPELLTYAADGVLYGVRPIGRVQPGNCCLVVAAPYSGDQ